MQFKAAIMMFASYKVILLFCLPLTQGKVHRRQWIRKTCSFSDLSSGGWRKINVNDVSFLRTYILPGVNEAVRLFNNRQHRLAGKYKLGVQLFNPSSGRLAIGGYFKQNRKLWPSTLYHVKTEACVYFEAPRYGKLVTWDTRFHSNQYQRHKIPIPITISIGQWPLKRHGK